MPSILKIHFLPELDLPFKKRKAGWQEREGRKEGKGKEGEREREGGRERGGKEGRKEETHLKVRSIGTGSMLVVLIISTKIY